ncbi:MAG: hypothetical protein ACFFDR_05275 [Candidatus Thorarchaeota archaeon]
MILDDRSVLDRMKEVALRNRIEIPSGKEMPIREMIAAIRAGLNGVLFSNVEKLMLPNWVISRIWEGGRKEKVPSYFPNDTLRNWALIGAPGGQNFAISDSHGLTTILESCGSIEFWPESSEIIYPALLEGKDSLFKLVSLEDQMYEWIIAIGPVTFQRLVYHAAKGDQEFIINEINIQNAALEPVDFTFFAALRPTSVNGVLPISSLVYDPSTLCLYSNEYLAIKLDRSPSTLAMSTFDDPNLEQTIHQNNRIDGDYSSARGTGTAIARYDIKLRPAGREKLIFVSPLFHTTSDNPLLEPTSFYGERDNALSKWFDFTDENPFGEYPDEELGNAAAQAVVSMVIQIRRVISTLTLEDIVLQSGEVSRILLAIAQSGYEEISHTALSEFVSKFRNEDEIVAHSLRLTPLLWVINEMELLWPDIKLSEEITSFKNIMHRIIKEIIDACNNREDASKSLSVPRAPSVDVNPDFEEIPSIESIQREVVVSQVPSKRKVTLGELLERYWVYISTTRIRDKSEEFARSIECYLETFQEDCNSILKTKPWDYESTEDIETILNLISACTLSKNFDIGYDLFETLVNGIREKRFFRGLIRYPGKDGRISSHHALRIAHAFVLLGMRHESELILARMSDYLSNFYYLPDWIDPKTKGGTHGSGCSINAAADLKLLLRDMMIYEFGTNLHIFSGIPEDWFTSERALSITNLPSRLGDISLATGVSANQHQIEIIMEQLPEEMEVSLPEHIPLHMVKVFGGTVISRIESPSNRIRLIPLSDQIAITFHRL